MIKIPPQPDEEEEKQILSTVLPGYVRLFEKSSDVAIILKIGKLRLATEKKQRESSKEKKRF